MALKPFRGLSTDSYRLWRHGDDTGGVPGRKETAGDPPVAGDLWIAALDGGDFGSEDVALVVLERVHANPDEPGTGHVVAFPVTPADAPRDERTLTFGTDLLDCPLALWPHLVTSIDFRVLARRIGPAVEGFTLAKIGAWRQGSDVRVPLAAGPALDPNGPESSVLEDYLASLTRQLRSLSDAYSRSVDPSVLAI